MYFVNFILLYCAPFTNSVAVVLCLLFHRCHSIHLSRTLMISALRYFSFILDGLSGLRIFIQNKKDPLTILVFFFFFWFFHIGFLHAKNMLGN